jgi:hypothetical protein
MFTNCDEVEATTSNNLLSIIIDIKKLFSENKCFDTQLRFARCHSKLEGIVYKNYKQGYELGAPFREASKLYQKFKTVYAANEPK